MSFDSVNFLVFFPVVVLLYYLIPVKTKYNLRSIWLLIVSYYFYMSWKPEYALLILFSTFVTYICSILLDKVNDTNLDDKVKSNRKKLYLVLSLVINLAILFVFKYGQFTINTVTSILSRFHIVVNEPTLDLLLPVGISFYTFQALGYTIDVYRGDVKAEKNFVQYALFVSFFPQLVAGPIERSKNLLEQLKEDHYFDPDMVRDGLLTMLWGFFMKLVIADRVALFVDTIYNDYNTYKGFYIVLATVLFGLQIYCDFNGYTMIARGAANVMGFRLMENFNAPYLSTSVAEFWKNWHISLTSWFRDYVYIPLGGNRKGKLRQYINILIVFGISGLWHGAEWSFVIWGLLNGIYQIIGFVLMPLRNRLIKCFNLDRSSLGHRLLNTIGTFVLVDFAWIFFRGDTIRDSFHVIKNMLYNNVWVLVDHKSIYECGLDRFDFELLITAIAILLFADILKKKNKSILKDYIYKQNTWFRWMFYIVSFLFVLIFGIWGSGYENAAFLYFQF